MPGTPVALAADGLLVVAAGGPAESTEWFLHALGGPAESSHVGVVDPAQLLIVAAGGGDSPLSWVLYPHLAASVSQRITY